MSGFSVLSAERCLAILEMLLDEPQGLPLSTISSRLDLPFSPVHRLLGALMARRMVQQNPHSSIRSELSRGTVES